mgnify:FL=1
MKLKLCAIFCLISSVMAAQVIDYKGEKIELGPHAFLVDGNPAHTSASPYVFKTFNEAVSHLKDGTALEPMRVYISPWVYWIDDPDDGKVRRGENEKSPIGLTVSCNHLQLLGMSDDPRAVILASARGQTQGAVGNFTMFDFYGDDLVFKDLTMGNYCNIDLVYEYKPELGRKAKYSAITQAQVAFAHGDRIYAENVRFEARLNLCNFNGSKRTLFVNCHTESTDDSLNGGAVYINCDSDFWGQQPFGSSNLYGTVFADCDFNVKHLVAHQCISKSVARFALLDCRYHSDGKVYFTWNRRPEDWLRCYQYNISADGLPVFVGAAKPETTVCMDRLPILGAYRLVDDDGTVIYNTYNLLRGDDDWDPMNIKETVARLSLRDGRDYANMATVLDINVREAFLETGKEPLKLVAGVYRHRGYLLNNQKVHWKVQPGFEKYARLSAEEGFECVVTPTNHDDATREFDILAYTEEGLQGAVKVTVSPDLVPAPEFVRKPRVRIDGTEAVVDYELALNGRKDQSVVVWYRDGIPVATSNTGSPKTSYHLTKADIGHKISVGVSPKHLRCLPGMEEKAYIKAGIKASQTDRSRVLSTDFSDFECRNQLEVIPGYWTVDAFKPADTYEYQWSTDLSDECWFYGTGINGAKGYGLLQSQQGARLRYTPTVGKYGDMSITWEVNPAKDGGQGFASARAQYLDLFIKFDTGTLSGYALRAIRTTKFANAVDIVIVKYTDGKVEYVSDSVSTDCFHTGCVMSVWTEGNRIYAHVEGNTPKELRVDDPRIHNVVDIDAPYVPNEFGGLGVQHTSTVGTESKILLKSLRAEWK